MAYASNAIMARIKWCRWQRTQARGQHESDEWHAEEDGLRDALLNRDHSNQYRYAPPGMFMRYTMGLQDGLTLLRMGEVGRLFRAQDKGQ